MPITLTTSNNQTIFVEDKPLATRGGEGSVHRIISPSQYNSHCVKLYFRQYRTRKREQKIQHMIKNPPPNLNGLKNGGCMICFPEEVAYENNKIKRFAGFIMPLAFNGSSQLYELCLPNTKKLSSAWNNKYDRSLAKGIESRLKLCVNIAAAINFIHANKYVLVDLKPQNILVTVDGKVAVIDLDSVQIVNNNQVLYHAQLATPEYAPVECNRFAPDKNLILETWDRFSLAVVFYEILFGLHPYAASNNGQYQNSTTVADKIRDGLFVYGSKKNHVFVKSQLHDNFNRIPSSLQNLFIKAFDTGHSNPSIRPNAEEWGKTIYNEIKKSANPIKRFTTTANSRKTTQPKTRILNYINQIKSKTINTTQSNQQQTPQSPAITNTPSNPPNVGKIIGWIIALVILFWLGSGIINFIGNLTSRTTQRNTDSDTSSPASNLCRVGSTGNLTTNVRLRREPNTNRKYLATHYRGAKVQVLSVSEGEFARGSSYWYRIKVLSNGCDVERPNVCGSEGSATEGWMHSAVISCN